jgi:hypothetical protein
MIAHGRSVNRYKHAEISSVNKEHSNKRIQTSHSVLICVINGKKGGTDENAINTLNKQKKTLLHVI